MTKWKHKRENPIANIFIDHLSRGEGVNYDIIDSDVPSSNGRTDFDYLLKGNNGNTLALEITQIRRSSLEPKNNNFDLVAKFLRDLVDEGKGLPAMRIHIPNFDYTENKLKGILTCESNRIDNEIREKLQRLRVGESFHVEIPRNYVINVDREHGMESVKFRPFMTHIVSSHAQELDLIYLEVCQLLLRKNIQLSCDADRKILLFLDTRFRLMKVDSVLRSALLQCMRDNESDWNFDDLIICHARDSFESVYSKAVALEVSQTDNG